MRAETLGMDKYPRTADSPPLTLMLSEETCQRLAEEHSSQTGHSLTDARSEHTCITYCDSCDFYAVADL